MYKKRAGNDKQGKDAGNRTICPYGNFSQAIMDSYLCYRIWDVLGGVPRGGSEEPGLEA